MNIVTCPKCKMQVLPKADGTCPSCLAQISRPLPGKAASAPETESRRPATTKQDRSSSASPARQQAQSGPGTAYQEALFPIAGSAVRSEKSAPTSAAKRNSKGYKCPRCGEPVSRGYSSTAQMAGGLVGALFYAAFGSFECRNCGKIATSEFPPEVRDKITRDSILLAVGAMALLIVVILLFWH
jgi:hypothetical protein